MSETWQGPLHGQYGAGAILGSCDECEVPIRFGAVEKEYACVRNGVGLSDNSHYGKFRLSGPSALEAVNFINLADISRLAVNKATQSYLLQPDARVLSDVYVLNQGGNYLLLTEGAPPAAVGAAIAQSCQTVSAGEPQDLTTSHALVGLDGPFAWELLKALIGVKVLGTRYLEVLGGQKIGQVPVTVLRAGKTGEFGYLLMTEAANAQSLWEQLIQAGQAFDVLPCGIETIDLCKLENRIVNVRKEGAMAANALELNCRVMVGREKDDYVGRDVIEAARRDGIRRRLIGLTIAEAGAGNLPAVGSEIQHQGETIGVLANTGYSYTLGQAIGVGFINTPYAYVGLDYELKTPTGSLGAHTTSAPMILNRSISIRPQEDSYKASAG